MNIARAYFTLFNLKFFGEIISSFLILGLLPVL